MSKENIHAWRSCCQSSSDWKESFQLSSAWLSRYVRRDTRLKKTLDRKISFILSPSVEVCRSQWPPCWALLPVCNKESSLYIHDPPSIILQGRNRRRQYWIFRCLLVMYLFPQRDVATAMMQNMFPVKIYYYKKHINVILFLKWMSESVKNVVKLKSTQASVSYCTLVKKAVVPKNIKTNVP